MMNYVVCNESLFQGSVQALRADGDAVAKDINATAGNMKCRGTR